MSMSALVRALGAAAGGVSSGMRDAEDAAERKRKREMEAEDRAYTMSERARVTTERDRADKMRADMGTASLPTTVESGPVAMPIGSRDEPRAPEDMGIRAAGQTFTDPAAATKAAADYNTPGAMALRQSQVAGAAGDPLAAQQLRTGAMQEQASKYQLDAAERADIKAKFVAQIQPLSTFEQLEEFVSRSGADGAGGAIKVKMVPSADGKSRVVNVIQPDGTLKPTAKSFENTPKGFALAKAELEGMPAEKMLAHLHTEAVEARNATHQAGTRDETARHNKEMERLTGDKTAAGITMAQLRADMAAQGRASKAAGAGPAPIWDDKADAFLRERNTIRNPETGAVSVDGMGMQFGKLVALAHAQRNGGDTTTALGAAFERDAQLKAAATDAKGAYDPAKHDALRRQALARMMGVAPAPEAEAKPAAPAAGKKDAPMIPVDPNGPKAPVAQPEKPGMVDRIVGGVKGAIASGAESGRQLEAIKARVKQADAGGKALSAAERAIAKQYGIVPLKS